MESIKILPLLLVSVTLSEVGGKNLIVECEENHECGENKFCYHTGLCASCTNCSIYFRMPHEWKSCSKSPSECGRCLPGYAADTLTDGSERELCTPIQQSEDSRSIPGGPGLWSNWHYGIMVIGIPLAVLLVILWICWKTGACRINRGEVLKTERPLSGPVNTRPPPYSSCGESPLLTRNAGVAEYHCGSVWHTEDQATGSSNYNTDPVQIFAVEKTIDGIQQAKPFEYHPEELQDVDSESKKRSSCQPNDACRPNDGTDHHDEDDDDNEDGMSVTHDSRANEVDHWSSGLSGDAEHIDVDLMNKSEEAATAKQDNVETWCRKCALSSKAGSSEHMLDRRGSLCNTALRSDHSTYSLFPELDIECSCEVPVQCSCKKNLVKTFFFRSKYDSGFISKCSVKFEELHNDTYTENSQANRENPSSSKGDTININLPVNVNILNHINVC